LLALSLQAGNWPHWRGPQFNGSADEQNLAATFSKTENVKWSVILPGTSAATPIIWEDHVFLSSTDESTKTLHAYCLDRKTGAVQWKQEVGPGYNVDDLSNFASPSPVTDGRRVWFFYGSGDLVCFDSAGKEVWHRNIQKDYGQEPQCILTMPLLEGLDGKEKMSKSLGNYIGIAEPPQEIFGKLMSVSDELMWRYIELLSFEFSEKIDSLKKQVEAGRNPKEIKVLFAKEIVARFHSSDAARQAESDFESRFRHGEIPEDVPERTVKETQILKVLKESGLVPSANEAARMIEQGAVRVDGERVSDRDLKLGSGKTYVIQVGKRKFARVTVK